MSPVSDMERKVGAMPKAFRDWFAEYYHAVCSGEGRSLSDEEVQVAMDAWSATLPPEQPDDGTTAFEKWYSENVSPCFAGDHAGAYHDAHAVFGRDVKAAWDAAMALSKVALRQIMDSYELRSYPRERESDEVRSLKAQRAGLEQRVAKLDRQLTCCRENVRRLKEQARKSPEEKP